MLLTRACHLERTVVAVTPGYVSFACPVAQTQRQQTRRKSRHIHTSRPNAQDALLSSSPAVAPSPSVERQAKKRKSIMSALASLPLSQVLRTYLITSVTSSPLSLTASAYLLRRMLESKSPMFRIDRNPVVRALLWESFYKQFCAGETPVQVRACCKELRKQGYEGVVLEYALEVLKDAEGSDEAKDVSVWREGMLKTVEMAATDDFVGLKWSGMGPAAMRRLKQNEKPSEHMNEAMHSLCKAAAQKGIALLPAAEETWSLEGVHNWSLNLQRVYNLGGKSVVYNTYQAYLKQTPEELFRHLATARQEGFTLGVKLVRGAYLGSEERSVIHDTITETHQAYDNIASALIRRSYNDTLKPAAGAEAIRWPNVNVVLATHNAASVLNALSIRLNQAAHGEELTPLVFAQLQGMADEVSLSLIAVAKASEGDDKAVKEKVLKCTTWGTMYECLNYLLRRVGENRDAAGRTAGTRDAMGAEIWRRMKVGLGLGA